MLRTIISIFLLDMTLNLVSSPMILIHPSSINANHEDEIFDNEIDAAIVGWAGCLKSSNKRYFWWSPGSLSITPFPSIASHRVSEGQQSEMGFAPTWISSWGLSSSHLQCQEAPSSFMRIALFNMWPTCSIHVFWTLCHCTSVPLTNSCIVCCRPASELIWCSQCQSALVLFTRTQCTTSLF